MEVLVSGQQSTLLDLAAFRFKNGPIVRCSSMMDGTCSCRCSQEKCKTNGATCRGEHEHGEEDFVDVEKLVAAIGLPY